MNSLDKYAISTINASRLFLLYFVIFVSSSLHADNSKYPDTKIKLKGALINISFAPNANKLTLSHQQILHWIKNGASAVADYYRGFPVSSLDIIINIGEGTRINGTTYPGLKPFIVLQLGENAHQKELTKDWVLVHEMVHLAFPNVYKQHHWMEEGLATYIEPIVRVRAGLMSEQAAWRWMLTGVPKGQPKRGDKGLDYTPTWGRIYWGGALYCLQADYLIRKKTKNRFNLGDALRAITKAGGTMQREDTWEISRALKIGDKATRTNVLMTLYTQMKAKPVKLDLNSMWQRLGVRLRGKQIVFNNNAPEASMRRALIPGR